MIFFFSFRENICAQPFWRRQNFQFRNFEAFKVVKSDLHLKEKHDLESSLIMRNVGCYTLWVGQHLSTQYF